METPFDGITDLVKTYTGYDHIQDSSSYSRFELVAPLWIRFDPGCLLDSRVAVARAFLRGGHEVDQASVGFIQMEGSQVVRRDRKPLRVVGEIGEAQHLLVETETSLDPQADGCLSPLVQRHLGPTEYSSIATVSADTTSGWLHLPRWIPSCRRSGKGCAAR